MFSSTSIGIDLGTANVLVYTKKEGIILNEPAVIAINKNNGAVIAFGAEAKAMIGKTPPSIVVTHPVREGVIADFDMATALIKEVFQKANKKGSTFTKPNVVVCVPSGATSVERLAIQDAIKQCGAKEVFLIDEPVAAAIGAELPVNEPTASVIVDIGGGTTEIGIISFGGIVSANTIKIGGDHLNSEIVHFARKKYNLLIGERTAEEVKITIGHAPLAHVQETMIISGRDVVSGLPKTLEVNSTEVQECLKEALASVLEVIHRTLETCPPELAGDIVDRGVILTGGGALLKGIDSWLANELLVPVHLAPSPLESVVIGTGRSLDTLHLLQKRK